MRSPLLLGGVALLAACQGPAGVPGTPGAAGTPGTPGVSGYEIQTVSMDALNVPRGLLPLPVPPCPGGKRVMGGGASVVSQNQRVMIVGSLPSDDGRTWRVVLQNDGPAVTQAQLTITKICAVAA